MKLSDCFFEWNGIIKEIDKYYRDTIARLGISESAFWILYTLREMGEGITQREIVETVSMPSQTINSALKKMEAEGFVRLESDRRSKRVYLTEEGARLVQRTADRVIAAEIQSIERFTPEEQETYLAFSHRYAAALAKNLKKLTEEA